MPITDKKITAFTKDVADLADKPNQSGMTAAQVKAQFDAAPNELRVAVNELIDLLLAATTGDSGAHNIGSAAIDGVSGSTVHAQLASLKELINAAAIGDIPDGSITPAKLAETAKAAQNISVADAGNHFTGTNVEGVLDELFTYANDGKTQVADAVTAKGVIASSTDTFSTLATKIGQINTGKRHAVGTVTPDNNGNITISGLTFTPTTIITRNNYLSGNTTTGIRYQTQRLYSTEVGSNNVYAAYGIEETFDYSSGGGTTSARNLGGFTISANSFFGKVTGSGGGSCEWFALE